VRTARAFAIVALIALALAVAPGGGAALNVIGALLGIAFFASIAFLGYRLYRDRRFTLETLPELDRVVLYGSIAAGFLAWVALPRFRDLGIGGWLAFIAILAAASGGVFWVFTRARRYD
jgi:hypothetical protein